MACLLRFSGNRIAVKSSKKDYILTDDKYVINVNTIKWYKKAEDGESFFVCSRVIGCDVSLDVKDKWKVSKSVSESSYDYLNRSMFVKSDIEIVVEFIVWTIVVLLLWQIFKPNNGSNN